MGLFHEGDVCRQSKVAANQGDFFIEEPIL